MAVDFIYDEEYEKVKFLGNTVIMPHAERIEYYRDKMNAIIKEYDLLEECLQEQADKCKKEGSGAWAWIQSNFWMGFECEENGSIVGVLSDILDMDAWKIAPEHLVVDEFGKNTKAYKELVRLRRILVREARDIENAYESSYQRGQNAAFSKAATNIKGMGFGIMTNSKLDLLAYNAISNATLRSQARKADKQYENDLKSLHKSTFGPYKNQLLSLMFEQYIPAARNCIAMWANEVTEKLIAYEVKYNNNAVFSEISKFNTEQSQKIVDKVNIGDPEDFIRKELLKAFQKCPYNESIYLKAAQAGVLDRETFEYGAGNYGYEKDIVKSTKKFCCNNLDDIELVKKQISFMIYVKTEEELLKEIYHPFVSDVIRKYNMVKEWVDASNMRLFINEELEIYDISKFIDMEDVSIQILLKTYFSSIISKKMWNMLIDNNLIEWRKISQNNTYEYEEMNSYYINTLFDKIVEYQNIMSGVNLRYVESLDEYQNKCNDMEILINKIEKDIEQIGIFGFKKKKLLREELSRKKAELYEFSRHSKPTIAWV